MADRKEARIMAKKRHTADQITPKLRETEILLGKGGEVGQACQGPGVHESSRVARSLDLPSSACPDDTS